MKALDIDQIVQEILTDMSLRDKAVIANSHPTPGPELDMLFEELLEDDDETGKAVMRRILEELQATHRLRRVK